jgi:hypothetical protein
MKEVIDIAESFVLKLGRRKELLCQGMPLYAASTERDRFDTKTNVLDNGTKFQPFEWKDIWTWRC